MKRTRIGNGARWAAGILAGVVAIGAARVGRADPTPLATPARVSTLGAEKVRIVGTVLAYDEMGFKFRDNAGHTRDILWLDLPARADFDIFEAIHPNGSAGQWLSAAMILRDVPDGGDEQSARAFARAARLDPRLLPQIQKAMRHPEEAGGEESGAGHSGPVNVGALQKHWWGRLGPEEQASAVAALKEIAEHTPKFKDGSLKLLETRYFLFYSDLAPAEAAHWSGLLDKMYDRMEQLFAMPRNQDIWRGKALIFVFKNEKDYLDLESHLYGADAKGTRGMCQSFGNGFVQIAFVRQANPMEFAHVLVHESTHGFVHRYRSPVYIPSWANEGLAETIAFELAPQPEKGKIDELEAKALLARRGVGDDFFTTKAIAAWQYPVAHNFCVYMIARDKGAYVRFINDLKDSLSVDEAMQKEYGCSPAELATAYEKAIGARR